MLEGERTQFRDFRQYGVFKSGLVDEPSERDNKAAAVCRVVLLRVFWTSFGWIVFTRRKRRHHCPTRGAAHPAASAPPSVPVNDSMPFYAQLNISCSCVLSLAHNPHAFHH